MPPLILSIETATRAGSLAITRGEEVLVARRGDASISHSANLLEQMKDALTEATLSLPEIDALAVAAGPGSFTGLRIGLATAKSIAATLNLHCVGIQTLHAVARSAGESSCTMALLPAGRGEVYAQKLAVTAAGDVQPLDEPTHLAPEIVLEKVSAIRDLKWAGEGAQVYSDAIRTHALAAGIDFRQEGSDVLGGERGWSLAEGSEVLAVSVGKLASQLAPFGAGSSPQDLRAIYVRPSDAESNA